MEKGGNRMRQIRPIVAAILFVLHPVTCLGAYLVQLKNGTSFVTNEWWEEESMIVFHYDAGLVRLQKDTVRAIRASDLPQVVRTPQSTDRDAASEPTEGKSEPQSDISDRSRSGSDKETILRERARIAGESETLSNALGEARERGDTGTAGELWDKLIVLQEQLSSLRSQVKAANGGTLPPWWHGLKEEEAAEDECESDSGCGPDLVCVDGFCV